MMCYNRRDATDISRYPVEIEIGFCMLTRLRQAAVGISHRTSLLLTISGVLVLCGQPVPRDERKDGRCNGEDSDSPGCL